MGTLIRENKRKIALSLNMGLLLMGCLMLTIGAYPANIHPINNCWEMLEQQHFSLFPKGE